MPTSWMLTRLKRNAQSEHVAANIDRLSLLHLEATPASYRDYLVKIFGFEAPVEAALARTPGLDAVIDLGARSHLQFLRDDLADLGISDVSALPQSRRVPAFRTVVEALGWRYVLEHNATLHGQVRRHLHKQVGAQRDSYLAAGERMGTTRVQELGTVLDRIAREPETARQVVEAVKNAFRCQRQWFAPALRPPSDMRPTRVA
jgi:heme oxygenase